MDNPDTDNTGYTIHRTKVRENRRTIKYGQSRHRQHWVDNTKVRENQRVVKYGVLRFYLTFVLCIVYPVLSVSGLSILDYPSVFSNLCIVYPVLSVSGLSILDQVWTIQTPTTLGRQCKG
jgi:hypothetical protein